MKIRSVFSILATAAIGFAFIAPDANALPRWKSSSGHIFQSHKKDDNQPKTKAPAPDTTKKTIGLTVKAETKKLRPYFQRKQGAPAYRSSR